MAVIAEIKELLDGVDTAADFERVFLFKGRMMRLCLLFSACCVCSLSSVFATGVTPPLDREIIDLRCEQLDDAIHGEGLYDEPAVQTSWADVNSAASMPACILSDIGAMRLAIRALWKNGVQKGLPADVSQTSRDDLDAYSEELECNLTAKYTLVATTKGAALEASIDALAAIAITDGMTGDEPQVEVNAARASLTTAKNAFTAAVAAYEAALEDCAGDCWALEDNFNTLYTYFSGFYTNLDSDYNFYINAGWAPLP